MKMWSSLSVTQKTLRTVNVKRWSDATCCWVVVVGVLPETLVSSVEIFMIVIVVGSVSNAIPRANYETFMRLVLHFVQIKRVSVPLDVS